MKPLVVILLLLTTSVGCMSQKQGIHGSVFFVSGNQMPGPDHQSDTKPVSREIYIYAPVKVSETRRAKGLYSEINATVIKKVKSGPDGTFRVQLTPGEYSVFTKENDGFFAGPVDGDGRVGVVVVREKMYTDLKITVDYQAVY